MSSSLPSQFNIRSTHRTAAGPISQPYNLTLLHVYKGHLKRRLYDDAHLNLFGQPLSRRLLLVREEEPVSVLQQPELLGDQPREGWAEEAP
jgi:hypothetical protein